MRKPVWIMAIGSAVAILVAVVGAQQAPPQTEAPAGPKNLTVLPKTWTLQQVRTLMQTFTESLGVQCNYCHSADPAAPPPPAGRAPTLDYTLDIKGEKDDARRMIRMVMAINGDYLKGIGDQFVAEKVTCFTCHAGSEVPASAPANGWARGSFSLLLPGPPARGRGAPVPN